MFAPAEARARAMPRPIPRLPPVTRAVLALREKREEMYSSGLGGFILGESVL